MTFGPIQFKISGNLVDAQYVNSDGASLRLESQDSEFSVGISPVYRKFIINSSAFILSADMVAVWTNSNNALGTTVDTRLRRNAPGVVEADTNPTGGGLFLAQGYRLKPSHINAQTGSSYMLSAADDGRTVTFDNPAPVTVTVPVDLGAGFSCDLVQVGAGQVSVVGAAGVTLQSLGGLHKTAGQFGGASVLARAADTILLTGQLVG